MQLEIPSNIRKDLAHDTKARLIAGTYGMRGSDTIGVGKKPIADNAIIFRVANAPEGTRDHQFDVGTLNPGALAPGNQIVILVVDLVPTNNIIDKFRRWRHGIQDGGSTAFPPTKARRCSPCRATASSS